MISRPEDGLAIAGFGQRDAPNDLGLPVLRRVFRNGRPLVDLGPLPDVSRLNDHHAFLTGPGVASLHVGDVLEVGTSNPCTTLQRWRLIYAVDGDLRLVCALQSHFG